MPWVCRELGAAKLRAEEGRGHHGNKGGGGGQREEEWRRLNFRFLEWRTLGKAFGRTDEFFGRCQAEKWHLEDRR